MPAVGYQGAGLNFYDILGVSRSAEQDVIDAAYRAMMRKYHPDKFDGSPEEAERRSKQLNEAYYTLRNPARRAAYDATLAPEPPSAVRYEALPGEVRSRKPVRIGASVVSLAAVGALVAVYIAGGRAPSSAPSPTPSLAATETPAPTPSPTATPTPAAPTDGASCRGASCLVMTPFGWAGIEAGVSTDSAQRSSGLRIRDDRHYTDATGPGCLSYEVVGGPANLMMLVENDTITTIEAYLEDGQPVFRTDRGVKLGDPESAVRKAYSSLKQMPNIYSEPPDKLLVHYEPGNERGIQFYIGDGVVQGISVGTPSIEYVEHCL